jgi:hypothetical protein
MMQLQHSLPIEGIHLMNKRLLTRKHVWVITALVAAITIAASQLTPVRIWLLKQTAPDCSGQFTADELRVRVIKNYLKIQQFTPPAEPEWLKTYELALIPRVLDMDAIKRGMHDGSLMNSVMDGRRVLPSEQAIDALDAASLGDSMTVAHYSTLHRQLTLTPLASIRLASAEEIQSHPLRRAQNLQPFQLSADEKARGFGVAVFFVNQLGGISLGCCDGLGESGGSSPEQLVEHSMKTLKAHVPRSMVVNSCGDLLVRRDEEYSTYRF